MIVNLIVKAGTAVGVFILSPWLPRPTKMEQAMWFLKAGAWASVFLMIFMAVRCGGLH